MLIEIVGELTEEDFNVLHEVIRDMSDGTVRSVGLISLENLDEEDDDEDESEKESD
jgi:hypothetical protein